MGREGEIEEIERRRTRPRERERQRERRREREINCDRNNKSDRIKVCHIKSDRIKDRDVERRIEREKRVGGGTGGHCKIDARGRGESKYNKSAEKRFITHTLSHTHAHLFSLSCSLFLAHTHKPANFLTPRC